MADLNKLRQVNPHWTATIDNYDGDIHQEDLDKAGAEGCKRHWPEENKELNEHYNKTWSNAQEVMAQQIEEEMNPSRYTKNDIAQTKRAIIDKILKHFDDELFEMVSEEMGKYYVFKSDNYLTEAGYDMFEDEWFEFYHEHHGDILFQVKTEINM